MSAVYHISADSPLQKKVKLTLEHFAELESETQTSEMTFFRARSSPMVTDGKEVYIFSTIQGGEFAVGEENLAF